MKQFFLIFVLSLLALFSTVALAQSEASAQLEAARNRVAERATTYINLRQQIPDLSSASQERRNEVQAAQEQFLAAQYTVARLSDAQSTYTVNPGDSLSEVATKFYGDANCWVFIVDANGYLEDPNMIIPGTILVIPTL